MSQSIYIRDGVQFIPTPRAAVNIHECLPPGNFIVQEDPKTEELYFVQVDTFEPYGRVYGNMQQRADRIMNTFAERPQSTGVLLVGEKGSGKTMLAKILCMQAYAKGMPTILINRAWVGDKFNNLIQSISQPAVIFVDEFEKIYTKIDGVDTQEQLLTLLDGVFPSKKMFILTCNDSEKIDKHMRNRPGRLFYGLQFVGLEKEFIAEYCHQNLNEPLRQHIPTINRIATLFDQFNFDMLKALVEEMNRYNESPEDSLEMLNIKPSADDGIYEFIITHHGKPLTTVYPSTLKGTPIGRNIFSFTAYLSQKDAADDETSITVTFTNDDLTEIDHVNGCFKFENAAGQVGVFTRQTVSPFNLRNALTK